MLSHENRRIPSRRLHKPTRQAVVTLNGKDIYLGRFDTKASEAEYDRIIQEWLAQGRHLPLDHSAALTVAELLLRFWRFAKGYYRKDGRPTSELDEYKQTLRVVRSLYGMTRAQDFGPIALKAVRQMMIDSGLSRGVVNHRTSRVKQVFKWAVAEELVPPSVHHGLTAVDGLRRGRTTAREAEPVLPVAEVVVEETLPHLSEVVADMVRFQRLTGCRPAEVCIIRPIDVDTTGEVWLFGPESHKTEHHGRDRVIPIGPRAQDVLRKYLLRPAETYCFCPAGNLEAGVRWYSRSDRLLLHRRTPVRERGPSRFFLIGFMGARSQWTRESLSSI